MRFVITGLILSLFLSACNRSKEAVDRQTVLNEMGQREIKRLLPGEIIEAAYQQGDTITNSIQQHWFDQYQTTSPASDLAEFLHTRTQFQADALKKKYKADIRWISPRDTAGHHLSNLEEQILLAYLYNVTHSLEIHHNVQRIDDEYYLYTKPVMLHENPAEELATQQQPVKDSARFLGMWSIKLSKKEIIQNM